MRGLTASDVLEVFERGRERGDAQRALLMLAAAEPGSTPDEFAEISVGRRNALLLRLRELTFGAVLEGLAVCPSCGVTLEVSLSTADLAVGVATDAGAWHALEIDGYQVRFRLPSAFDLVAIESLTDRAQARLALIGRCVEATQRGRKRQPSRLPASVIAKVAQRMASADSQAFIDLQVRCPSCDRKQTLVFDIASFLWREVQAQAPRLLREVHELASAYGWREEQVLSLSPWRRSAYLDLVGA